MPEFSMVIPGKEVAGTYSHPSGTTEGDAVVITPDILEEYDSVILDLSGLAQTTTIRVYIAVDGTNYRQVDRAEFPTDFPTGQAAVGIRLLISKQNMKVTLQSSVAEGAAVSIPYFFAKIGRE